MNQYCLQLMGFSHYQKIMVKEPVWIEDIRCFAQAMNLILLEKDGMIGINDHLVQAASLSQPVVKKQLFDWMREAYVPQ